jgi:hypothetical protein
MHPTLAYCGGGRDKYGPYQRFQMLSMSIVVLLYVSEERT